ncbi:CaiB/BaiF CoA transferase family protein [Fundicoccus culcitae]|uniref:CoA transferase n=1 Tax=Fundicoccus culcitae TaxID=2969821 RepID=A0ABY5P9Q4_9LACT|nr:CaiB/BaiF CoA-transferase family protein [Fundicoccus culcitae]UUX35083.1 CoA transferase [Fundicoccus culcitae]
MEYTKGSALEGLKVLDLGRVIAAPFAAAMLADLGADVIKIEMPQGGDNARDNLPMKDGESTYFIQFNRSKRGMTLDMKKGRDILVKLVEKADVVLENFRPGVMEKLGFGYEELRKINPQIIMASVSGFGQTGPYSQRAGYDPLAQAMSGMMDITGYPENPPVRAGASIADVMAAQNAVIGVLAALEYRNKTGEGQYIDVSLLDATIVSMSSVVQGYLTDKSYIPTRRGNGYLAGAPGGLYECKDGNLVLMALGDRAWNKLVEVMDQKELLTDPRFETNQLRVANYPALDDIVNEWTRNFEVHELESLLLSNGLPAGAALTVPQMYENEHVNVREMFTTVNHPTIGDVEITNQGIKMSKTSPYVRGSSPLLGEHTDEILKDLGYSDDEIATFRAEGVI